MAEISVIKQVRAGKKERGEEGRRKKDYLSQELLARRVSVLGGGLGFWKINRILIVYVKFVMM